MYKGKGNFLLFLLKFKTITLNVLFSFIVIIPAAHDPLVETAKYDRELGQKELQEIITMYKIYRDDKNWLFFQASQHLEWRNAAHLLLEQNVDINDRTGCFGSTALTCAANTDPDSLSSKRYPVPSGSPKTFSEIALDRATFLLDQGALVDHPDGEHGWTPFMYAATSNNKAMMQLLLSRKANINIQDKYGQTPLIKSAGWAKHDALKMLLRLGADTTLRNIRGRTALEVAQVGPSKIKELILAETARMENYRDSIKALGDIAADCNTLVPPADWEVGMPVKI